MNIVWSEGHHTTCNGRVGPLYLFTISWKSTREDPNWVMSCALPGLEGERWKDDDENVLRERAAGVLAHWLRRVFGILPERHADESFDAWLTGDGPLTPVYDPNAPTELKTKGEVVVHLAEAFTAGWHLRAGEAPWGGDPEGDEGK